MESFLLIRKQENLASVDVRGGPLCVHSFVGSNYHQCSVKSQARLEPQTTHITPISMQVMTNETMVTMTFWNVLKPFDQ